MDTVIRPVLRAVLKQTVHTRRLNDGNTLI